MSRLYASESGRAVPSLGEELTTWRRARKRLHLPPTASPATLYVLAFAHPQGGAPLRLAVNGVELPPVAAAGDGAGYLWRRTTVEPSRLRPGENVFELWCDATAMNGWAVALEPGHERPRSAVSDDGGATWRSERMGYLNVLRGEYVLRLRLAEGVDPAPPEFVWEPPQGPHAARQAHLRSLLPPAARAGGSRLARVRALTAWLSASWEHTSTDRAAQYAPWDAETILRWGAARSGHNGQLAITYCVHYAVAFVTCCQALGIPARCAPVWGTVNGGDGHFVAEVWLDAGGGAGGGGKWVMVDPNLDALLCRDGAPLSIGEIQALGDDLAPFVEWGPGTAYQRRNPRIASWIESTYLNGLCFRHRSLWPRADFLAHPECSPPAHGATAYAETDLVWEARDLDRGLGMFPSFAPAAYFDAPPAESAGAGR